MNSPVWAVAFATSRVAEQLPRTIRNRWLSVVAKVGREATAGHSVSSCVAIAEVLEQRFGAPVDVGLDEQSLLGAEIQAGSESDHVGQQSQLRRLIRALIELLTHLARSRHKMPEVSQQFALRLRSSSGSISRVVIANQIHIRFPVVAFRRKFARDPSSMHALKEDVVASVGLPSVGGDSAEADHRFDLRPTIVLFFPARLEEGHGNQPVAGKRVLKQLTIP